MTETATIKRKTFAFFGFQIGDTSKNPNSRAQKLKSESGMSLIAVMAIMTLFAIAMLAVAPSVQLEVQREKELEAVRRGEEIANAIEQYINHYQGRKLPESIDDLLEGLPQGTKKRQILRPSAAVDPLSEDGKWQLVPVSKMKSFMRRVQNYNNGVLPSSENVHRDISNQVGALVTNADTNTDDDTLAPADETDEETFSTSNTPFVGVVSQSKSRSVIAYYGIENHSKWVFTPLFRGSGINRLGNRGMDRERRRQRGNFNQ